MRLAVSTAADVAQLKPLSPAARGAKAAAVFGTWAMVPLGQKTLLGYFPFYLDKFKIELENLDQTLGKKYSSEGPFVSSDISISSKVWHRLAPVWWAGYRFV